MTQKIIIDADPGIGDALAIVAALIDPELDVLALTATGGMVPFRQAESNLQSIVSVMDPPKSPRIGGGDPPMSPRAALIEVMPPDIRAMHGLRGLGDWAGPSIELAKGHDAIKVLLELTKTFPNEITLLTLGPLTNLALAMERDHLFLSRLKSIVSLGGSFQGIGDVTPVAEFNILCDPEAARKVLRAPATKSLVPLEIARQVTLTFEQWQRNAPPVSTPPGNFLQALIPFSLRAHHQHQGLEGMPLLELTALAFISKPDLFEFKMEAVDVELDGTLTRGMLVFDRRARPEIRPNVSVIHSVDRQGVLDYAAEILRSISRL